MIVVEIDSLEAMMIALQKLNNCAIWSSKLIEMV